MKNTGKITVLASVLGLMLIPGTFAAEEGVTPSLPSGANPTMDQPSGDMTMDAKGARGPVRTESMEHYKSLGEKPGKDDAPPKVQQAPSRDSSNPGGWNTPNTY